MFSRMFFFLPTASMPSKHVCLETPCRAAVLLWRGDKVEKLHFDAIICGIQGNQYMSCPHIEVPSCRQCGSLWGKLLDHQSRECVSMRHTATEQERKSCMLCDLVTLRQQLHLISSRFMWRFIQYPRDAIRKLINHAPTKARAATSSSKPRPWKKKLHQLGADPNSNLNPTNLDTTTGLLVSQKEAHRSITRARAAEASSQSCPAPPASATPRGARRPRCPSASGCSSASSGPAACAPSASRP